MLHCVLFVLRFYVLCFLRVSTVGFSCVMHRPGAKVVCPRASLQLLSDGSSANAFMFGIKGCEDK